MKKTNTLYLVQSGIIAAMYAAATYLSSVFNLAYGQFQFRLSEAFTILPVFTPAAIPGLAIGCVLGNLASPYGVVDIALGTLATLLAAIMTRATRNIKLKGVPLLAPLFPVITNCIIVGAEITFFLPEGASWAGFAASALSVGVGETAVCWLLGLPLYLVLQKTGAADKLFAPIHNK